MKPQSNRDPEPQYGGELQPFVEFFDKLLLSAWSLVVYTVKLVWELVRGLLRLPGPENDDDRHQKP